MSLTGRFRAMLMPAMIMWTGALGAVLVVAAPPEAGRPAFPDSVHRSVAWRLGDATATVSVWVFLADKGPIDEEAALQRLAETYHPRAIRRRELRRTSPGLFDRRDLPVWDAYVRGIERQGATVRVRSRWLNAVSAEMTAGQVESVARLPFVEKIQIVRGLGTPEAVANSAAGTGRVAAIEAAGGFYGVAGPQLSLVNLVALHNEGFTGSGVVIGILDTGFRRTHEAYNEPGHELDVIAEYDFVNDDGNTAPEPGDLANQHDHGTNVLGVIGAYAPNLLVGGAYDASFILVKPEDLAVENTAEEDLFVAGLEFIEANGGDVATSSLVINGVYTPSELDGMTAVMSRGLKAATDNGLHCFQGAGNSGHDADPATSTLVPPADAFGAISVGAVDVDGSLAWFTSDGPSADGRVKPEILSMGVNTLTTDSFDDQLVTGASGTSFATPLAAAAAACIVQKHPDWTVPQLRAALFQTASWHEATQSFDPQYVRGYGLIDAHAASNLQPKRSDLDEDFSVGVSDLLRLLAAWGPCPPPPPPPDGDACHADFDGDGNVGTPDLLTLLLEWGPTT